MMNAIRTRVVDLDSTVAKDVILKTMYVALIASVSLVSLTPTVLQEKRVAAVLINVTQVVLEHPVLMTEIVLQENLVVTEMTNVLQVVLANRVLSISTAPQESAVILITNVNQATAL